MAGKRRAPDDNPHLAWCMVLGVSPSTTTNELVDLTEALQRRADERAPASAPVQKFPDEVIHGFYEALAAS